jgi:hypothetical protein
MFIDSNATPHQLRSEERNTTILVFFKILSAPPNGAGGWFRFRCYRHLTSNEVETRTYHISLPNLKYDEN